MARQTKSDERRRLARLATQCLPKILPGRPCPELAKVGGHVVCMRHLGAQPTVHDGVADRLPVIIQTRPPKVGDKMAQHRAWWKRHIQQVQVVEEMEDGETRTITQYTIVGGKTRKKSTLPSVVELDQTEEFRTYSGYAATMRENNIPPRSFNEWAENYRACQARLARRSAAAEPKE